MLLIALYVLLFAFHVILFAFHVILFAFRVILFAFYMLIFDLSVLARFNFFFMFACIYIYAIVSFKSFM